MAFQRVHTASADGTFSSSGAAAWNAAHGVSGATVGGIPYFPTATSEAMSGMTWNASAAAGEGLAIAAGTATTAVNALSITQTWNNAAVAFKGIFANFIGATNAASGALPVQIQVDSSNVLTLDKTGVLTAASRIDAAALRQTGNYVAGWDGGGNYYYFFDGSTLRLQVAQVMQWSATADALGGTKDTGVSRLSAGVVAIGTGAAGSFAGRLKLTSTIIAAVAVGSLNASPTIGEVQTVNDALAVTVKGATVAAGGSAVCQVMWNGSNWVGI